MSADKITLNYRNDNDRAFGLAGMAISLAALDAIDYVSSISIDAEGPMVTFADDFYFSGSSSISPKATWNNLLHNFYVTSAMVIANIMARSFVDHGRDIPTSILDDIRAEMIAEGQNSCALDEDEVDSVYTKSYSEMRRIFANSRLHPAIKTFAKDIEKRRELSALEIIDELKSLRLI